MSYLEELLEGVEVEWKHLGRLFKLVQQPTKLLQSKMSRKTYRTISNV